MRREPQELFQFVLFEIGVMEDEFPQSKRLLFLWSGGKPVAKHLDAGPGSDIEVLEVRTSLKNLAGVDVMVRALVDSEAGDVGQVRNELVDPGVGVCPTQTEF